MSIQATCDSCGKTYSVNEKYAGKRLPCKECGELFEVQGEDDFDLPPVRARRPAAGPARSGQRRGKRRRSGPNWVLIGTGSVCGLLVAGGLVWAIMTVSTNTHEKILKKAIAAMGDIADIVADVNDVPSAQAAVPKLEAIEKLMEELEAQYRELDETTPITDQEERKLREKYSQQIKDANQRIRDQMKRLESHEEAHEIIVFAMIGLQGQTHRVVNARRVKQVEEHTKRVEQHHEMIRQKQEEARAARERERGSGPAPHFPPRGFPPHRPAGFQRPEQAIVLRMKPVPNIPLIRARLQEMSPSARIIPGGPAPDGVSMEIMIAPVPDVQTFADAIDFGEVTHVDQANRTIAVEPDVTYRFHPRVGPVPKYEPETP